MSVPVAVIKKTQDSLGKFVKKPSLTDKLLSKPPFRFLHDVISIVIKERGILKGLYTEEEMHSDKVKDKESKLRYLEKVISAVSLATGRTLSVKPGKVISGQEPVKTNELLQALGEILIKKIDTTNAVAQTLNKDKKAKKSASKQEIQEPESKPETEKKVESQDKPAKSDLDVEDSNKKTVKESTSSQPVSPKDASQPSIVEQANHDDIQTENTLSNEPSTFDTRPGSAMTSARPHIGSKVARPPSSRPAAPRLKEKTEIIVENTSVQKNSGNKSVNVIVDNSKQDEDEAEDDGEQFLVEETNNEETATSVLSSVEKEIALQSEGNEHGALVQQILKTQKDYMQREEKEQNSNLEHETGLTDISRRREREFTQREIDKLRDSIQTLTRYANPLGKLMDFLQEDVDSMEREMVQWKKEKKSLSNQLQIEESLTQKSVAPLITHLKKLELSVEEQMNKISLLKADIIRNDQKMARMIGSIGIYSK